MKELALTLHLCEATHTSGNTIISLLLKPTLQRLNISSQQFADQLANAIQHELLMKGKFSELTKLLIHEDLLQEEIQVNIEAASSLHYPALSLPFEMFLLAPREAGDLWTGFVPVLGLTAVGKSRESLRVSMQDNILLEFIRKKRLSSIPSLLSTQWFSDIKIIPHAPTFFFYTLSELEQLQQEKEEILIQKILEPLENTDGHLVGMDKAYEQLITTLKGNAPSSLVIVGSSGKGKTEMVHQFVRERSKHDLKDLKVWQVTAAQLIHRLTAQGSWEEYLSQLCNELRDSGDILYFPRLIDLFEVGQYVGNTLSVADYLRDYISRGDILILTECSAEEAAQIELRAPGFLALFREIRLPELDRPQLEEIVVAKGSYLAQKHGITASEDAALETLRLQQWFTPYSGLPGKALVFLDSLFAEKKKTAQTEVAKADIYQAFCQETGMPEFMINEQLPLEYEAVNRFFQENIYGQEEAIETVMELLFSIKAAVIKRGKPLASLLFVGPTGVGKTEMAKVLAQFLFGKRDKMIRFDMSEYTDLPAVMRLTGDAGTGDGLLTATVRQNPFSVILFDELEKVHPSFYDLLLQILGEGRLTDARGRVADFCSTIIIMTSNIGARAFQTSSVGFSSTDPSASDASQHFQKAVQAHFRPELFNRLDRIIAFAPLQRQVIRRIVDRELVKIKKREGFVGRDLNFQIEEGVPGFLGEKGYNVRYGARFLQRSLRERLIIPLAHELNQYAHKTPLNVRVYLEHEKLHFEIKKHKQAPLLDSVVSREKNLSLGEFIQQVTDQRRLAYRIMQAAPYANVISKLDQLERIRGKLKKRNKENEFWNENVRSKKYMALIELQARMAQAAKQIEHLERENFLLIHSDGALAADHLAKFADWEAEFTELKTLLIQKESPESAVCSMGIYGKSQALFDLANIYLKIIDEKGFHVTAYTLWHDSQPNEDKEAYVLKNLKTRYMPEQYSLIGVEMEIKGDLSYFFFQGEEGFHRWVTKKRVPLKYHIALAQVPLFHYERPEDVHRQKFFAKQNPRRIYHPTEGIEDSLYKVSLTGRHFEQSLLNLLNEKFGNKLNQHLIS